MDLLNWIDKLDQLHPMLSVKNEKVSKGSVGWHLDHCYKVIIGIIREIEKSDPNSYSRGLNLKRMVIMTLGWFPRGRARAPKAVNNRKEIKLNDLQKLSHVAKKAEKRIKELTANQYFKHPYFGNMNRDDAVKFLAIHTHHHLKIIRDILK